MRDLLPFLLGLALSALVAGAAYWRGALAPSGALGAVVVGTLIFGGGGWVWGLVLITFFVLSSLLSHYRDAAKLGLAEKFDKGARRDLGQALANGGVGALVALAALLTPAPGWLAAFVGAMATANADTWATELGVLSRRPPRLVTTGRVAEPGTSGAISALGTGAALAGAGVIGLATLLYLGIDRLLGGAAFAGAPALLPAALLGGLAGALFDSLLGATVQAIYYSAARGKPTERRLERDGTPNHLQRGWRWMTNDLVNLLSTAVGALVGAAVWGLLR